MVEFGRVIPVPNEVAQTTTTSLTDLSYENLRMLVNNRLIRSPADQLRPLDNRISEDPSDIFIDIVDGLSDKPLYQPFVARMHEVCVEFSFETSQQTDETIAENAEAVGELLFLSARIGVKKAIPYIAVIAGRNSLNQRRLSTGEDIQNRALRSLSGLLSDEEIETKLKYKKLYEEALTNQDHITTGLSTLLTFFPEDRDRYVSVAREQGLQNLDELLELWENL